MLSDICAAFGCTPDVAERQDMYLLEQIGEYRAATQAVEVFRAKDRKWAFETLANAPALTRMLGMMNRAQRGLPLEPRGTENLEREGMAVARDHASPQQVG